MATIDTEPPTEVLRWLDENGCPTPIEWLSAQDEIERLRRRVDQLEMFLLAWGEQASKLGMGRS